MKSVAIFLSGIAATLTGASIRSCQDGVPQELLNAWCGPAPHNAFSSFTHAHCAGCVVMYAGIATMVAAIAFATPRAVRALRRRA